MPHGCPGTHAPSCCLARLGSGLKPAKTPCSSRLSVCISRKAARSRHPQLKQRHLRCRAASEFAAPAPGAPVPGDNHGALIHQLLNDHAEEVEAYVREGLQEALEDLNNGQSKSAAITSQDSSNLNESMAASGPPEPQGPNQTIPHRWRIVAMMSLAFILCNMDKVGSNDWVHGISTVMRCITAADEFLISPQAWQLC